MDLEFHYYVTYFLALRSGFDPEQAYLIAYSSQYTDDNNVVYSIFQGGEQIYSNYISQTLNILKPQRQKMRIYSVFHFMPGTQREVEIHHLLRKDKVANPLNTVPDNDNSKDILQAALASGDVYRIGIASHMHSDTFAHQNFSGLWENFNDLTGVVSALTPSVGHADVACDPDYPAYLWTDTRLEQEYTQIDNTERFLLAARSLYSEYCRLTSNPSAPDPDDVMRDLKAVFGASQHTPRNSAIRVKRYKELIGAEYRSYAESDWFEKAVEKETVGSLPEDDVRNPDQHAWLPRYQESHWFKFQEAVKAHQREAYNKVLGPIVEHMSVHGW